MKTFLKNEATESQTQSFILNVSMFKFMLTLSLIALAIILLGIASAYMKFNSDIGFIQYGFVPKFNMDGESNIPTYFSSFILLLSSVLFIIIALSAKSANNKQWIAWIGLSVIFFYLSIDESAGLHEMLNHRFKAAREVSSAFRYPWVISMGIITLVIGLLYLKFYLTLPSTTKIGLFFAAFFYIGGAIGFEMLGASYSYINNQNFIYHLIAVLEETLEITGVLILILTLLNHIKNNNISFKATFSS